MPPGYPTSGKKYRRKRRKRITEDDPRWNPYTMGNKRGGTKRYPRRFNRPT